MHFYQAQTHFHFLLHRYNTDKIYLTTMNLSNAKIALFENTNVPDVLCVKYLRQILIYLYFYGLHFIGLRKQLASPSLY